MMKTLIINMSFIISFVSVGSQLFKNHELNNSSPVGKKLMIGLVTGMLGITLMIFGMNISNTVIDLRHVAVVMSAVHGGTIPVIISSLMIAIFRIAYFGINVSSIMGVVLAIIVAIGCVYIGRLKIKDYRKWIYSTIYNLTFSSIIIFMLIKDKVDSSNVLPAYWVTTCIISYIVYNYVDYCLRANEMFRKLKKESTKDFLTGLNNVRQFDSLYNDAIKSARENKENLSLLMVDIDFFKKVNDTYGHGEGDIVLKELGKVLSKSARSFDIVSRNGGEEFTVMLLDCSQKQAVDIAERIRNAVQRHSFILSNGTEISITVSIGIASYPDTTLELEKLLEQADIALYAAKRTGRNKVCTDNICAL
jgi:diguanylate cyclase